MDKDLKLYEIAYLISPAYSEEEARSFHQSIKDKVQALGGLVEHDWDVAKKRLAYPVKKMWEAHLGSMMLKLAAEKLSELKTSLGSKEVLRFMVSHGKRQPPKSTYKPRSKPLPEKISTAATDAQPASNIAEIDKKLEEILGK